MLQLASLRTSVDRVKALSEQVIAKLNAPDPGQSEVDAMKTDLDTVADGLTAALNPQPTLPGLVKPN